MGEITSGWLHISNDSGSGTVNNITAYGDEHTGRQSRSKIVSATTEGSAVGNQTVQQLAKALFVTFDADSYSCQANDTALVVTGVSNAAKLQFSLDEDSNPFELTANLQISTDGVLWSTYQLSTRSLNIPGDPGKDAQYHFKISLRCPANSGVSTLTRTLTVTADNTETDTCTVSQSGANSSISVGVSGNIPAKGGASNPVTLTVTSNDDWTLSVD